MLPKRTSSPILAIGPAEIRTLGFAFVGLTVIAVIVFTQNYVKHAHTTEYFSAPLSLAYNFIVYSSFALFVPIVVKASRRFPIGSDGLKRHIVVHIFLSLALGFAHMLFCNLVLYGVDLSSSPIFPRFLTKYLTNVIHFHLLAYWTVLAFVSDFRFKRKQQPHQLLERFVINHNRNSSILALDQVLWIEALDHYQKLHTKEGFSIYKDSMANLERQLPEQFLRVHRSAIVNTDHIIEFKKNRSILEVSGGLKVPVGKSFKTRVRLLFK